MEVIMSLASRVVVFHQGKEIARGSPREVTAQPGGDRGLSRHPRRQGRRRPHADRIDGRTRDMTGPLLKIEHLEVRYGDLIGVSDVSLEVPEGSVVALLGSNGGGKTTTLNAIAGLIPVHSGSISFAARRSAARARLRSCARGWRCRRRAGGCSCSKASRTICCSAPRRCSDKSRAVDAARARLRDLSEAEGAAQPARRHHVRRRAADARGRPRADERPETADAGRAVARAWRRPWWNRCTRPSAGCTARA